MKTIFENDSENVVSLKILLYSLSNLGIIFNNCTYFHVQICKNLENEKAKQSSTTKNGPCF